MIGGRGLVVVALGFCDFGFRPFHDGGCDFGRDVAIFLGDFQRGNGKVNRVARLRFKAGEVLGAHRLVGNGNAARAQAASMSCVRG